MKKSKTISLFKIVLFVYLFMSFRNPFFLIAGFLYLCFDDYKQGLLYVFLCLFIFMINQYRIDFFPIAMVDKCNEHYVIADKLFYKVRIDTKDVDVGDVLYFNEAYEKDSSLSDQKKNILFQGSSYRKLFTFQPRRFLYLKCDSSIQEVKTAIKRFLYNEYVDDSFYDLGYGLVSYYFLRHLSKKSRMLAFVFLILFSLLFTFDCRYYLLLTDLVKDKNTDRRKSFSIRYLIIEIINHELFHNLSFLFPFLLDLFRLIDNDLSFKTYLMILSSYFFHEISLTDIFFYKALLQFRIALMFLSLLCLFIPWLSFLFLHVLKIYSYINNHSFSIRGKISFPLLFLFLFLCKKIKSKQNFIQPILLIILLLSVLNDPFYSISFIDVGQGDATMIKIPYLYSCILIDTGSPYNYAKLKSYLFEKGIYRIDHLIITHDDSDHNGNIDRLKKDFKVMDIIEKGQDFNYHGLSFKYLYAGDYDNDNDNSLIYSLNICDLSFLFTGDISAQAERELIRRYKITDIDVLKVSHHGSNSASSEDFIAEILPEYSIISTSGMYNHPHKQVLDTLQKYQSRIYITKNDGTISFHPGRLFSFLTTAKNEFVIMRT